MHVQDPAKNKQSKSNVSCTLIVTYDTELNLNTNPILGHMCLIWPTVSQKQDLQNIQRVITFQYSQNVNEFGCQQFMVVIYIYILMNVLSICIYIYLEAKCKYCSQCNHHCNNNP